MLGQYEDVETGLYYNRFRYYDSNTGTYISEDPIKLEGNNPNFYANVYDSNTMVDPLGLDLHHIIPNLIFKEFRKNLEW
ncbi:RHS repeat-associated core domain-containing protein [Gilliamella sp. B3023]|uniref:RHS repeat-associated core domain-containing protein n=1 Tax=Gilliamella sp. B3023 TaxID=2817987 RepID=UPI00226AD69D|nr:MULTISPECIES: RHS repeat-associated core domain-containing protein [unclassified Gilliamella]MCX8582692.1 RHS repeat-associated core domain-containing protein [Gilliamella sp. B3372]MCX8594225.1 RHS repeat-associated core domain-containing protein [Gilliamella sp. B3367]MCX8674935.1 RHS repeat-associated core domain-containing protein [Gilliamella sp. B3023]